MNMIRSEHASRTGLLAALLLLPCTALHAQNVDEAIFLPAARVSEAVEAVAAMTDPLVVNFLERRDHHSAIMGSRAESGEPELHESFDDVYFVQQGQAELLYGGTYQGGRTTEPGELRGGEIREGRRQPLAPGDVVVVPADVVHQVVVEPGATFIYLVLKVRRGK